MKILENYKDITKLFIIEEEEPEKEEPEAKKLDKGMDDEEDYEREFDASISINGKQYKPIKESISPTAIHPFKKTYKRIGGK